MCCEQTLDKDEFLICIFYLWEEDEIFLDIFLTPWALPPSLSSLPAPVFLSFSLSLRLFFSRSLSLSSSVWYLGMLWNVDCDRIAVITAVSHSLWIHPAFSIYPVFSLFPRLIFSIKKMRLKNDLYLCVSLRVYCACVCLFEFLCYKSLNICVFVGQ